MSVLWVKGSEGPGRFDGERCCSAAANGSKQRIRHHAIRCPPAAQLGRAEWTLRELKAIRHAV